MPDEPLSSTSAPPPAYKNRRTALIVFGIIEILIGLCCLGMALLMALVLFSGPPTPNEPALPFPPSILFGLMVGFYCLVAAIFIAMGIGSIKAQRWVRVAMLVMSSLWLAFGLFGALVAAIVMPVAMRATQTQQQHPLDASVMHAILIVSIVITAFFYVILPLTFLLFYSTRNVRLTLEAASITPAPQPSPRPLLVSILGWYFFVTLALSTPIALSFRRPYPFFGTFLTGWTATIFMLLWAVAFGCFAWEFYQLRLRGWYGILGLALLGRLSHGITLWRVGWLGYYRQVMGSSMALYEDNPVFAAFTNGWFQWIALVGFSSVLLILLLFVRKHFSQAGLTRA